MKKLLLFSILAIALTFALASCSLFPSQPKEDVITVEDGYLVVNGVKTEYKVDEGTSPEVKEDVITVEDGYLVVNGVKTEYKVDKEDVIEFVDGYLVVNGVKTEYYFSQCDHVWQTSTVAPTCREGGYDIKTCLLCDKSVKLNYTAKLDHSYSDSYLSDISYHWHACTACGDVKDKAEHQPTDDGMCAVCEQPVSATPGVIYDLSADGTYAIVAGYKGTSTKIRIADTYEGLPVTTIYDNAFCNINIITSVIIPDSVTAIGNGAFSFCYGLSSVVIGDNVTTIGGRAFISCSKLTSVVIGDSVTTIGKEAFCGCDNLTSVVIGDSVTTIGDGAFSSCYKLTSVVIPDSVTTIGNWVFEECRSLSSVVLGNGLTTISSEAFHNCSNLTSVTIPDSVTTISYDAFLGCKKLSSIIIPDSVLNLGSDVFSSTAIQFNEYENCMYLGSGDNPYYYLITVLTHNLSNYKIHEDTKVIAGGAFSNCSRITSLIIPEGVIALSDTMFYSCDELSFVVIPDSVIYLNYIEGKCDKLKNIYYTGSEADWKAMEYNYFIKNNLSYYTIHYNYVPEN